MLLLTACSQTPPLYFGPQLASLHGEIGPQAINSPAFAILASPLGRPGYLDTIRYIDDGMKYMDPFAEFFISYDGQMCFRGLGNRHPAVFENYQNYWCLDPAQVSNVEAPRDRV